MGTVWDQIKTPRNWGSVGTAIQFVVCLFAIPILASGAFAAASVESAPFIQLIQPDPRGGIGYRLTYFVNVPLDIYWRFKTDFDNGFVVSNQYIRYHRFLNRTGRSVFTENQYTFGPNAIYKWHTRVGDEEHRLDYYLLNPKECGQKFHYGYIQAQALGQRTRVVQVAYFDFFGASIWAHIPWSGGMKDFLRSTARWEQETALRLKEKYAAQKE